MPFRRVSIKVNPLPVSFSPQCNPNPSLTLYYIICRDDKQVIAWTPARTGRENHQMRCIGSAAHGLGNFFRNGDEPTFFLTVEKTI